MYQNWKQNKHFSWVSTTGLILVIHRFLYFTEICSVFNFPLFRFQTFSNEICIMTNTNSALYVFRRIEMWKRHV